MSQSAVKGKKRKRVLVLLPFSHISQRKLCGIFRFADETDAWELHIWPNDIVLDEKAFNRLSAKGMDGVIVSLGGMDWLMEKISRQETPIALIEQEKFSRDFDVVKIKIDEASIGREAALFFLRDARWNSYGYVHSRSNGAWDSGRVDSFRETLGRHGARCEEFPRTPGGDGSDGALERWLENLPKPAAVFAVEDYRAYDILNACRNRGLKVPKDVAVMGVGNTEAVCENANPSLSTVEPDYEMHGYLAARHLDRIMSSRKKSKPIEAFCGVRRIVVRESTPNARRKPQLLVQKALAYIRANAHRGIKVGDVLSHLRVSRTLAVTGFREVLGKSMLETIHDVRLDQTRKALVESNDPISEICVKCGWRSENNPKRLFKAKFGVTMREYRMDARK